MVGYNIVHFCRLCKVRFVTGKEEAKKNYCKKCMAVLKKSK